jgi:3-oxoacyl-[acyl-carrier-protein] synthase-1
MPLAILGTGLVTAVGQSAPASCAAFRAKISNATETRFIDSAGDWIMAHQVELAQPWRGLVKLAKMAAMSIEEALQHLPRAQWTTLPLILCVAEKERPGRLDGLDESLFELIEAELGLHFAAESAIVAHGRVSTAVALQGARRLLLNGATHEVLIAAADSLVSWETLSRYEQDSRLLTPENSNGFIPGEGAGALRIGPGTSASDFACLGVGFSIETAHIDTEEPLRGEGMAAALRATLDEAGVAIHDVAYRIADVAGEHYYFKESALALQRLLRQRRVEFDIWHPAECTGELGAASGPSAIALAYAAHRKCFAMGPSVLAHWANDGGQRAAALFSGRAPS